MTKKVPPFEWRHGDHEAIRDAMIAVKDDMECPRDEQTIEWLRSFRWPERWTAALDVLDRLWSYTEGLPEEPVEHDVAGSDATQVVEGKE